MEKGEFLRGIFYEEEQTIWVLAYRAPDRRGDHSDYRRYRYPQSFVWEDGCE
jgi:hypothetical protein